MSKEVIISSAVRTPIGGFNGSLSSFRAPELGAKAIEAAVERAKIEKKDVQEVVFGNVLTAGVGQAPARQAAIYAGLEKSTPCMTINKVCGSGLKAVMLASDSVQLGHSQIVVAGGQESMSQAPHLLTQSRSGYRMGDVKAIDSMVHDGLWDPYNNYHMGNCGEICAREYKFSREEQDAFAKRSYERAQTATKEGYFKEELVPVEVKTRKETLTVDVDEDIDKVKFEKIPQLRPAFDKEGSITAANASNINDGASALVITDSKTADQKSMPKLAKILGHASYAHDPTYFTTAPIFAAQKVLQQLGLQAGDIDLWEINEAFAVVTMAAIKDLGLDPEKVNVHGGAVSMGHPIGASGARILTTLVHALKTHNKKYGCASICIGGGEAVAVVVENLS